MIRLVSITAGWTARTANSSSGWEETRSLGLKMDLIKKYDLAGVAGWRLGAGNQRRLGCDWLGVETI